MFLFVLAVVYFEEEPIPFWRAKIRNVAVRVLFLGSCYRMKKSSSRVCEVHAAVVYLMGVTVGLIDVLIECIFVSKLSIYC